MASTTKAGAAAAPTKDGTTGATDSKPTAASSKEAADQHAPSLAGSVIEASDGMGGKILIRIQNIDDFTHI